MQIEDLRSAMLLMYECKKEIKQTEIQLAFLINFKNIEDIQCQNIMKLAKMYQVGANFAQSINDNL
jgi:hypothetical protein